jgi:hypothetical protein
VSLDDFQENSRAVHQVLHPLLAHYRSINN